MTRRNTVLPRTGCRDLVPASGTITINHAHRSFTDRPRNRALFCVIATLPRHGMHAHQDRLDTMEAILDGRQPAELGVYVLREGFPVVWGEQPQTFVKISEIL